MKRKLIFIMAVALTTWGIKAGVNPHVLTPPPEVTVDHLKYKWGSMAWTSMAATNYVPAGTTECGNVVTAKMCALAIDSEQAVTNVHLRMTHATLNLTDAILLQPGAGKKSGSS